MGDSLINHGTDPIRDTRYGHLVDSADIFTLTNLHLENGEVGGLIVVLGKNSWATQQKTKCALISFIAAEAIASIALSLSAIIAGSVPLGVASGLCVVAAICTMVYTNLLPLDYQREHIREQVQNKLAGSKKALSYTGNGTHSLREPQLFQGHSIQNIVGYDLFKKTLEPYFTKLSEQGRGNQIPSLSKRFYRQIELLYKKYDAFMCARNKDIKKCEQKINNRVRSFQSEVFEQCRHPNGMPDFEKARHIEFRRLDELDPDLTRYETEMQTIKTASKRASDEIDRVYQSLKESLITSCQTAASSMNGPAS